MTTLSKVSNLQKAQNIIAIAEELNLNPAKIESGNVDYTQADEAVIELISVNVRDALLAELVEHHDMDCMMDLSYLLTTYKERNDVDDSVKARILMANAAVFVMIGALTDEDEKDPATYEFILNGMLNTINKLEELSLAKLFRMMLDNGIPWIVFVESIQATIGEDFE